MDVKVDIVIFGATGMTGKNTVRYLVKYLTSKNNFLTWGIAGRSYNKLINLLIEGTEETTMSINDIPIIIADVNDKKSLDNLAKKARVIINCCGPFRFLGEAVVKACINQSTHYVDVTSEIQFIELMQLKYHHRAEEKGIYVISACAYQSMPVELGINFLEKNFNGVLNSVEAYLELRETKSGFFNREIINYSTLKSMLYSFVLKNELKEIRKQLHSTPMPECTPKLKLRKYLHKSRITNGWLFPFRMTDYCVVNQSQRYFYERNKKRPIQFDSYFGSPSFKVSAIFALVVVVLFVMNAISLVWKLILKYPRIFTVGYFSKDPAIERFENSYFKTTLYAEGWQDKVGSNENVIEKPNAAIVATVEGPNPAYQATCTCAILAAVTILTQNNCLPPKGGVYPPGYAFANTSIIDELNANNVVFKVVEKKQI